MSVVNNDFHPAPEPIGGLHECERCGRRLPLDRIEIMRGRDGDVSCTPFTDLEIICEDCVETADYEEDGDVCEDD